MDEPVITANSGGGRTPSPDEERVRNVFDDPVAEDNPPTVGRSRGSALAAVDKAISEVLFDGQGVRAGVYAISEHKRVEIAKAAIEAYRQWLRAEARE